MSDEATGKNLRAPTAEVAKKQRWGEAGPGRPLGSKHKLSELFISELVNDFDKHGAKAIQDCRKESPKAYLDVIAKILPKDVNLNVAEVETMSEEEIDARLAQIEDELGDVADTVGDIIRDRAAEVGSRTPKAKARKAKTTRSPKPSAVRPN